MPTAGSIWTPGGEVSFAEKDVIPIDRNELIMLSRLHEFANKYGIVVLCKQCDHSLQGKNNDTDTTTYSINCKCREFRFTA